MKFLVSFAFVLACCLDMVARSADSLQWRMFEGEFYNKEYNISLSLNLYDTVLVARNYEFLGKMNGYMRGTIHETWFLTSYTISGNSAVLSFSNEMGSESQDVKVTVPDSLHMSYETVGGNVIRKAVNGKWVKLPSRMTFLRRGPDVREKAVLMPADEPRRFRMY